MGAGCLLNKSVLNHCFQACQARSINAQNLIRRQLSSEAGRQNLAALPAPDSFPGRLAYARAVCEAFEFRDPRGRLQETGCPRAPGDLDDVVLPPPQSDYQPTSEPNCDRGRHSPCSACRSGSLGSGLRSVAEHCTLKHWMCSWARRRDRRLPFGGAGIPTEGSAES